MQPNQNDSPFDKRTLLAFALIGLVWVGYFALFPPESRTPQVEEGDTTVSENDLGAPARDPGRTGASREASTDREPNILHDDFQETERPEVTSSGDPAWASVGVTDGGTPIKISTPLFEAEIDPVGADIASWILRRYDVFDGGQLELVGPNTTDRGSQRAHALRVLFDDEILDLRRVEFRSSRSEVVLAEGDAPQSLILSADRTDGGSLQLEYTFDPAHYGFDVTARMTQGPGRELPVGLRVEWPGGISFTEPDSTVEAREMRAVARVGEEIHKVKFTDLTKGDGSKGRRAYEGTVNWAGVQSMYFLSAVVEAQPQRGTVKLGGDGARGVQTFAADVAMLGRDPAVAQYSVYMGPVDYDILARYDKEPFNAELTKIVDLGPGIFRPVATVTLVGLRLLHQVIPNWGWTIILFSVFTKLLFWPLTKSSTQSMKKMQDVQPKLKALQKKYKDDAQRQSQEMMKLYKEHGVNPLNMGGCLPLLLQMPVFWALFTILRKTIDLRQAEFGLWINDLSRPDSLFTLPFSLPIFGDNFALLPFLMAGGMWAQTKLQQPVNAAQGDNPMAQQMKMMSTLMPVMMFFFFYNSPSGLVLYWLVNTALTAFQTWRIHSQAAKKEEAVVATA